MTYNEIEKFCKKMPGATMSVQWGEDHVFKVGGKMFAVVGPPGDKARGMSFKAGDSSFAILTKQKGIIPAPYLARAHWVYLERSSALNDKELKAYLTRAHAIVAAGLSRKLRASLGIADAAEA
ncbi:MAG TPA: MmcQ/YjbR family DNA-binding protein [Rhizomicrobium sp.]